MLMAENSVLGNADKHGWREGGPSGYKTNDMQG